MNEPRDHEHDQQHSARRMYGTPSDVTCATRRRAPCRRASPPRRPSARGRRPSRGLRVPGRSQRVDQPGLDRAGEEREPQPEQHETIAQPQNGALVTHMYSRGASRSAASTAPRRIAEAPAPRVGHDAGRDLEDHLPDAEECVGGERLRLLSPASSRKSVLTPQMNEAASVLPSTSVQIRPLNACGPARSSFVRHRLSLQRRDGGC